MTNDPIPHVNATTITTEKELAEFLSRLGFVTEPGDYLRVPVNREIPCRCIFWKDGPEHLRPVAISLRENSFDIFFFNELNQWFNLYNQLEGDVSEKELQQSIVDASLLKGLQ